MRILAAMCSRGTLARAWSRRRRSIVAETAAASHLAAAAAFSPRVIVLDLHFVELHYLCCTTSAPLKDAKLQIPSFHCFSSTSASALTGNALSLPSSTRSFSLICVVSTVSLLPFNSAFSFFSDYYFILASL